MIDLLNVMETKLEKTAWKPLESNSEALTKYMASLGVSEEFQLVDVFSLDEEFLAFIPQPCVAVIFLFPLTPQHEYDRKKLLEAPYDPTLDIKDAFFIRQTIKNACGTIALLHAILNNLDCIDLALGEGVLKELHKDLEPLSPEERAKKLEQDSSLAKCHAEFAEQGQTAPVSEESELNLHFTTFVSINGDLVELDGRHPYPKKVGACPTKLELLTSCAKHFKQLIQDMQGESDFSILALVKKSN